MAVKLGWTILGILTIVIGVAIVTNWPGPWFRGAELYGMVVGPGFIVAGLLLLVSGLRGKWR